MKPMMTSTNAHTEGADERETRPLTPQLSAEEMVTESGEIDDSVTESRPSAPTNPPTGSAVASGGGGGGSVPRELRNLDFANAGRAWADPSAPGAVPDRRARSRSSELVAPPAAAQTQAPQALAPPPPPPSSADVIKGPLPTQAAVSAMAESRACPATPSVVTAASAAVSSPMLAPATPAAAAPSAATAALGPTAQPLGLPPPSTPAAAGLAAAAGGSTTPATPASVIKVVHGVTTFPSDSGSARSRQRLHRGSARRLPIRSAYGAHHRAATCAKLF